MRDTTFWLTYGETTVESPWQAGTRFIECPDLVVSHNRLQSRGKSI